MGLENIYKHEILTTTTPDTHLKKIEKKKEIEVLKFLLDSSTYSKQKMFVNFLTRFIQILNIHVSIKYLFIF